MNIEERKKALYYAIQSVNERIEILSNQLNQEKRKVAEFHEEYNKIVEEESKKEVSYKVTLVSNGYAFQLCNLTFEKAKRIVTAMYDLNEISKNSLVIKNDEEGWIWKKSFDEFIKEEI